jgi:hypothetical protein
MFIIDDLALAGLAGLGSLLGIGGGAAAGAAGAGASTFAGMAGTLGATTGAMAGVPAMGGIGSSLAMSASPFAAAGASAAGLAGAGATAGEAAGGGLFPALGNVGTLLSGIGGIAQPLMGMLGLTKESPQAHMERRRWERTQQPVAQVYEQLFYNPAMKIAPYSNQPYNWSPRESTKALYETYLNREYGIPEGVARAMSSQALSPLRVGSLEGAPTGSAAGLGAAARAQPGQLAQAGVGLLQPALAEQQGKMQSAQQLAQYNLWRAQQLGGLIG